MFDDNDGIGDRFSRMKNLTPEQYTAMAEDYAQKSDVVCNRIRKVLIGFAVALGLSFAIVNLIALFNQGRNFGDGIGVYVWMAFPIFLLPLTLFDPKQEQKFTYERDYDVLLRNKDRKLKLDKVRFYTAIGLGVVCTLVHAAGWYVCLFTLINSAAGA